MLLLPNYLLFSAAVAITATLSASSARNMWSTYNTCLEAATPPAYWSAPSAAAAIHHLQQCSRRESLEIFLYSARVPMEREVEGVWDGILLENNGFLMTRISHLLTHFLFSSGRRWNGKAFGDDQRGINRFATTSTSELNHSFDYKVERSALKNNQESLVLRYQNYQHFRTNGWTSLLWKSMVDEIRLIECPNGECVLIGMGSMGWSGGMYNGSPFCLYRPTDTPES